MAFYFPLRKFKDPGSAEGICLQIPLITYLPISTVDPPISTVDPYKRLLAAVPFPIEKFSSFLQLLAGQTRWNLLVSKPPQIP